MNSLYDVYTKDIPKKEFISLLNKLNYELVGDYWEKKDEIGLTGYLLFKNKRLNTTYAIGKYDPVFFFIQDIIEHCINAGKLLKTQELREFFNINKQ